MNRAGRFVKQLSGDMQYKSFLPTPLQELMLTEINSELSSLLADTSTSLGRLDGMASYIPDVDLFVSLYIRKEALLSSQIEGTQATLDDILDPAIEENKNAHVSDVLNYIKATQFALDRMRELPLCNRLLKEIHEQLLSGIRGDDKNPGEFRRSQNWIGPVGGSIRNATFIPPAPDDMTQAMSDLEKYINMDDSHVNALIRAALIHYQFETIHPFLDGNGRIGRLLISLFLMSEGVLEKPILYISYFLKLNRIEYYDRLMEVRNKSSYEQWVRFFIKALHQTSEDVIDTINRLVSLREKNRKAISALGRTKNVLRVYEYIEKSPIIDIGKTSAALELSFMAVSRAVEKLCELGILQQTETTKRNRCFAYEAYLHILRKDT